MRVTLKATTNAIFAYNLIGSKYSAFYVPIELGTQVWFSMGGTTGTAKPALVSRDASSFTRATTVVFSDTWDRMDIQLQDRNLYTKYGAQVEPQYFDYSGSRFRLEVVGSIWAPDVEEDFANKLFWGFSGSNFYTRFAGFGQLFVEGRKPDEGYNLYGTLVATSIPVSGSIATLIWRGTNDSGKAVSMRRFTMLGSYTGTAGAESTVAVIMQEACSRDGGHVNMWEGDWEEVGNGTVWAATFYVCPFFATFRYKKFEVEVTD